MDEFQKMPRMTSGKNQWKIGNLCEDFEKKALKKFQEKFLERYRHKSVKDFSNMSLEEFWEKYLKGIHNMPKEELKEKSGGIAEGISVGTLKRIPGRLSGKILGRISDESSEWLPGRINVFFFCGNHERISERIRRNFRINYWENIATNMYSMDPILSAPFCGELFALIMFRSNFDSFINVHHQANAERQNIKG